MSEKISKHSSKTLVEQLMAWILRKIDQNEWPAGTKLPSQRALAELLHVNRSTVVEALDELKAEDVLESRQGSGVFVKQPFSTIYHNRPVDWRGRMTNSHVEANVHTIQLINEYETKKHVIRLGTGELSPELIPTAQLQRLMHTSYLTNIDLGYSEPKGNEALREAIVQRLKKRGIETSKDGILIVSGALQALQLISLGLLEQGSHLYFDAPSYIPSIPSLQATPLETPINRLKKGILYTVPTLNNPTGQTMNEHERIQLLQDASKRGIPIIEDDVYHDLSFESSPKALKSMDTTGQVIYISSVSKTVSPGLRIGWVVAPTPVIERLADVKMQLDYGSNALSQHIVTRLLSSDDYDDHIQQLRRELKKRADYTEHVLMTYLSHIAHWQSPKGGFYIWVTFKEPIVTKSLFLRLLKRNVLINPGYVYNPRDLYSLRISFAYCTNEQLRAGLQILAEEVSGDSPPLR
ncbi:PLP-dependent aminotransferase family protein [Geomicrobium sediminis]|uniref:GntR family transcriptional regulator of abcA and norABC n=1 Tax=Geomicrobium sediminis TaxID=1347788 RepID=A0ABS2PC80_9BACL|nr:PLP-dependent aminotransferase family protein [Geomicrobium sediminis]MBM7633033.1 GntR family transcriptional regulator of abcA and norABC [Geomicrobium sediminis]